MFKMMIAVLGLVASFAASAVEPVPMADVKVAPELGTTETRTAVPSSTDAQIRQSYTQAMNEAVQARGTLDILAVGPRAVVVITEYHDPQDFATQSRDRLKRDVTAYGGQHPLMARGYPQMDSASNGGWDGRAEQARIAGYIEFDGKRVSFEETAAAGTPMNWLASEVGRTAFRRILAL